ncbi:hypothetical protein SAMN06264364_102211 [Quadrisphaera granulorum]|uniref:Uncharacterized protein n=1 Tax=Quadrisphaera granulorum TaxID=317664 RepID=A0A316AG02_9ACTN|nr:hypothetical protein [Quadrisphaera granulorum]PWJ55844.1 hypothetical protein BXY45_102211 [Quadrisphaera granulorum]SZE95341.1 hypothetical protein SAMN06264364_102211 [Quadrisphaera granulorum]
MASLVLGRDAGRALAGSHLLLLPDELPETVVLGLVRARHPDLVSVGGGTWRLGRWTTLRGPLLLDAAAAAGSAVPDPWRCAWVIECPVDRGDPPLPGTTDREGLHRAFPDGLPVMAERRALDLALALARRLEGAVRVAARSDGTGWALLQPDPSSWVDRTVLSPSWVTPEDALAIAAQIVPGAELAVEGTAWEGLTPEAIAALEATHDDDAPPPDQREVLHLAADARDAAVAAGDDVLDAYALVVVLPEGGVVQFEVAGAAEPPPALHGVEWAASAVTYSAVWWPDDPAAAEHEVPAPDVRRARARAGAVIEALTDAVAREVGGVVVDADGFPLA